MWESAPFLPALFSPDWALFEWIVAFATILFVAGSRFRLLATPLARVLSGTVAVQGVAYVLAFVVGHVLRERGGNPSDVYVLGALVGALALIFAVAAAVNAVRKAPPPVISGSASRVPRRRLTWWEIAGVVVGALALIYVTTLPIAYIGLFAFIVLLFGDSFPWTWPPLGFAGVLFAAVVLATTVRLKKTWKADWPSPRMARLLGVWLVASTLTALLVKVMFLATPSRGMTDSALVTQFVQSLQSSRRAGPPIDELRARPRAHSSGLEHSVGLLTKTLGKPDSPGVRLDKERATRVPHRESFLSVPGPYPGNPELALVCVLAHREDLDELHAWFTDEELPADFRLGIASCLLDGERRHAEGRPERVFFAVGRLCATSPGAEDCTPAIFQMLGTRGARRLPLRKTEAFAATYAVLRLRDWESDHSNEVVAELLMTNHRDVVTAVALAMRAVERKDPKRLERWEDWSRADPVRCESLTRLSEILCPSAFLHCPKDSWDYYVRHADRTRALKGCFEGSSLPLPAEFQGLSGY